MKWIEKIISMKVSAVVYYISTFKIIKKYMLFLMKEKIEDTFFSEIELLKNVKILRLILFIYEFVVYSLFLFDDLRYDSFHPYASFSL